MKRKLGILVCLALWSFVPGCAQLPSVGNSTSEGMTKIRDRAWAQQPDAGKTPAYSTAVVVGQESVPLASRAPSGAPDETLKVLPVDVNQLPPLGKEPPKKEVEVVLPEAHSEKPRPKRDVELIHRITPSPTEMMNTILSVKATPVATKEQDPELELEPAVRAFHLISVGKHQEAIKALNSYDDATQEFLIRILPLLAQIAHTSIDKMPAQQKVALFDQVQGVHNLLRERCELLVTKMVYSKRIRGFADYEALPADHAFLAKTDNRPGDLVQLYVELKNFASRQVKEGDYLTKLACSLELKDMRGQKVWSHTFDRNETTHRKSACVNDYHGNYSFYVPALPPGTYQLTIQVVDETIPDHRRVARKSQDFRVTPVANQLPPR